MEKTAKETFDYLRNVEREINRKLELENEISWAEILERLYLMAQANQARGHWVRQGDRVYFTDEAVACHLLEVDDDHARCSFCGGVAEKQSWAYWHYCPNCGAWIDFDFNWRVQEVDE